MADTQPVDISPDDIHTFLEHFSRNSHRVKGDPKTDQLTDKCLQLFAKDYQFSVIMNASGELCGHYPSKLVLLEYQKTSNAHERVESLYDVNEVRDMFKQARFARCRSRFVVPVILYGGKHVCRSATVSSGAEMYSRSGLDFFFPGFPVDNASATKAQSSDPGDQQMFDRVRGQDIKLLKMFSVKYIVDLMMEKKKVKFGMNVTSSEKVDKLNRYGEFCIVCAPYPGCEFFREWKDNSYLGEVMKFDWNQGYVDACLDIPATELLTQLHIDWSQYQRWNLIQITQNYLKMLIHVLTEGDKGVLIHCISGWDRTPMFVSLLRLSLWADGAIHKSLSAVEILYLTLVYDWYLFGHHLSDRLNKGEEIMLFCFNFLTHITSEQFAVPNKRSSNLKSCVSDSRMGTSPAQDIREPGLRRHLASSSSSINSAGSFSTEPAPGGQSVFFLSNEEETCNISSNSPSNHHTSGTCLHTPPSHHVGSPAVRNVSSSPMSPAVCNVSSSPMEVPSRHRGRQPSGSDSPCGSWQVISGTGSLLTTERHSFGSHKSSTVNSCEEITEICSERWEKLDTVKRLFHNAYHNKISTRTKTENGITNLLDQFAEKVGIKSVKSFH